MDLEIKHLGGTYEVALTPDYDVLEGILHLEDGTVPVNAEVSVTGGRVGWREGLHTPSVGLNREGRFQLLVPRGLTKVTLEARGLESAHLVTFPLRSMKKRDRILAGENRIHIFSLDPDGG